jgi:hypothetical protein
MALSMKMVANGVTFRSGEGEEILVKLLFAATPLLNNSI